MTLLPSDPFKLATILPSEPTDHMSSHPVPIQQGLLLGNERNNAPYLQIMGYTSF